MELAAQTNHLDLVEICKLGDKKSFQKLYYPHAKAMFNASCRIRFEDGRTDNLVFVRTKMDELKGSWDNKKKGEFKEQSMQIA